MPFGFSTFSSFGHDKTRLGWAAGLYGGYRFNSIFSVELSAKYGEMNLSAQDCCVERNYWLGSDGVLNKAGVIGMDSWEYANLKSHVRMGRYGERVNVHLLGLFHKTANSRWDLAVSPHIYAVTLKEHGKLSRTEIDSLLWNVVSDQLDDKQKKSKIGNMLTNLRKRKLIENETVGNYSKWSLVREEN